MNEKEREKREGMGRGEQMENGRSRDVGEGTSLIGFEVLLFPVHDDLLGPSYLHAGLPHHHLKSLLGNAVLTVEFGIKALALFFVLVQTRVSVYSVRFPPHISLPLSLA